MRYRNIILVLLPLVTWLFCQAFLIKPRLFYFLVVIALFLIFFSVRYFVKRTNNRRVFMFSVPPLLFFLSMTFYSSVLSNRFWLHIVFILIAWFLFAYIKNLYDYFVNKTVDNLEKLDNFLLIGGFLTIFATSSTLFILPAFLNWPFWAMFVVFIPVSFLLFNQFLAIKGKTWQEGGAMLLVNVAVLTEIAWVFSLLPLNFNVLGCLVAIFYYLLVVVNRLYWRNNLSLRNIKIPLILTAIVLVLLFLTARWL